MKSVNSYSDDFKRKVASHYLGSDLSMAATAKLYGLKTPSSVQQWVKRFCPDQALPNDGTTKEPASTVLPDSPEGMLARIRELESDLASEKLKNLAANKMIDIAERDLKINIRKSLVPNSPRNERDHAQNKCWDAVRTVWQNETGLL
ncbi:MULTISPECIES: helix-turn-helix domain-containing protein [Flavobacteriaceae]|jgi:transposase-like protein|nr:MULTISPECIES: helix-turn-helix domain-containing protein [Allomuricauda]MBW8244302.1 helix-turn-helix domain-containing protein [Allomuricauda oceani]NDV43485.1 helix-turn-helix domain-containing protein [Allomuricauda sediminis]QII43285.1 helix-turn-helix domain-containing protein [Allomuricauda oceani]RIV45439.1 helix-turn-helix domain-containing protein [Allomuricauda maritima]TXJ96917.1 helix-turn-helix domain-containing protein [Allomuricauda maritima]